jgi:hypothetical protein
MRGKGGVFSIYEKGTAYKILVVKFEEKRTGRPRYSWEDGIMWIHES